MSSLFSPVRARDFLKQLEAVERLFDTDASYEETVERLHKQIEEAEALRADIFEEIFKRIRPWRKPTVSCICSLTTQRQRRGFSVPPNCIY